MKTTLKVKKKDKPLTRKEKLQRFLSWVYACTGIGYILVGLHSLITHKKQYKYYASLCLIFKDEAPFLKEWIEYHRMIGIDHFYLYNNNSTDNFRQVIDSYVESGVITLIEWEKDYSQAEAYKHCYDSCRNETHWLGYIDADEFLNLHVDLGDDIKIFLKKFDRYPSLHMPWRIFGSSGIMEMDYSKPVIEQFTQCWPYLHNEVKSFINNDYDFMRISVHYHIARFLGLPIYGILTNRMFSPYMKCSPRKLVPKLCVNHYWCKSFDFFLYKAFVKTDVCSPYAERRRQERGINLFELQCSDRDYSIQRWLVNLKERLKDCE